MSRAMSISHILVGVRPSWADAQSPNARILLRIPDSVIPDPVADPSGLTVVNLAICRCKQDVSGVFTRIALTIGNGVLLFGNLATPFRLFNKEFDRIRVVWGNCGVEGKGGGVERKCGVGRISPPHLP